MKCSQFCPGFELVSPSPFPMTITITPQALPQMKPLYRDGWFWENNWKVLWTIYIYIYIYTYMCVCVYMFHALHNRLKESVWWMRNTWNPGSQTLPCFFLYVSSCISDTEPYLIFGPPLTHQVSSWEPYTSTIYVYIYIYIYECECVCMCVCVCVCVCVCDRSINPKVFFWKS